MIERNKEKSLYPYIVNTYYAYSLELITVVSTPFTECRNSPPDFYVERIWVIFGTFTINDYNIANIDVETPKLSKTYRLFIEF